MLYIMLQFYDTVSIKIRAIYWERDEIISTTWAHHSVRKYYIYISELFIQYILLIL